MLLRYCYLVEKPESAEITFPLRYSSRASEDFGEFTIVALLYYVRR